MRDREKNVQFSAQKNPKCLFSSKIRQYFAIFAPNAKIAKTNLSFNFKNVVTDDEGEDAPVSRIMIAKFLKYSHNNNNNNRSSSSSNNNTVKKCCYNRN